MLIDDPSFEVEDYFSDWDEMSDEYYDDEPTILKRQRMARKVAESESTQQRAAKPVSKKKTNQTRKGPKSDPGIAGAIDLTSFQSVVWKLSRQEQKQGPKFHLPGEGEKVALLKNWREVFKSSHPSLDRSRRKTKPPVTAARPGAMDDRREDSSDRTSGVPSLENLRENETVGSIDASNTTPTKSMPPHIVEGDVGDGQDEEMVDAPSTSKMTKPTPSSNVVVEIPVPSKRVPPQLDASPQRETSPPKKKGRKRKADTGPATAPAPAPATAPAEGTPNGIGNNSKRPRSAKGARSASKSAGTAGASTLSPTGSVRRSTRSTRQK